MKEVTKWMEGDGRGGACGGSCGGGGWLEFRWRLRPFSLTRVKWSANWTVTDGVDLSI